MGTNWTRIGFARILERMGADTDVELIEVADDHAAGEVAELLMVEPGAPVRVSYALTTKGGDLQDVVDALERWGRRWSDACSVPTESSDAPPRRDSAESIV